MKKLLVRFYLYKTVFYLIPTICMYMDDDIINIFVIEFSFLKYSFTINFHFIKN